MPQYLTGTSPSENARASRSSSAYRSSASIPAIHCMTSSGPRSVSRRKFPPRARSSALVASAGTSPAEKSPNSVGRACNRARARARRPRLAESGAGTRSRSFEERGYPCAATATPPIKMWATPCSWRTAEAAQDRGRSSRRATSAASATRFANRASAPAAVTFAAAPARRSRFARALAAAA
jgi:hypothetical protein